MESTLEAAVRVVAGDDASVVAVLMAGVDCADGCWIHVSKDSL